MSKPLYQFLGLMDEDTIAAYLGGFMAQVSMLGPVQCSRIRILRFFQISKKHDFLRFFEMTCQKKT